MKKSTLLAAVGACASLSFAAPEPAARPAETVTVTLGDARDGHDVPKSLWGIFFEDINWAADGGLSVEMLANGGFDWGQADHEKWTVAEDGWEPDYRDGGMARLSFQYNAPVHPNTAKHLRIESFGTGRAGVRNRGLDGMWLKAGEPYRLAFNWRELTKDGIDYADAPWQTYAADFTHDGTAATTDFPFGAVELAPDTQSKDGRWTFAILVKGRRCVEIDNVTLKPTGPNLVRAGLRKDLVDKLAALQPAFVRFPGGCIVEEGDFQHWYDWRRTVGPRARRECILNRWTHHEGYKPYWETFDVGFYEYFRLCEELGAEPLPICLSGLTCQFQKPALCAAVEDVDYFADVILELIEFANGGVDTTWGRVRAEMGHPAPFNLKMVGIGNENWNKVFFDRCEPIAKIVRARHPEITIVGSSGPAPDGEDFDYAWKRLTPASADLVDEHYYRSPEWFLASFHRYDGYDRTRGLAVYAGEYACHHRVGKHHLNTHWSAVCEAVGMAGFERNSDIVKMASYAPLFAHVHHCQWSPDLIWFDGTTSWVTPNYYVQQLFSLNRPDRTIPATLSTEDRFVAVAGRKGAATIVKFVNAAEAPRSVAINLAGRATLTTLAGAKEDMNRPDAAAVTPVTTSFDLDGALTLPACSVSVLVVE